MAYTEQQLADILHLHDEYNISLKSIKDSAIRLLSSLSSEHSKEYLSQGFLRRVSIMDVCIKNIFDIFPPERIDLLERGEVESININLHTFTINIAGAIDNLAWVYVLEKNLYTSGKKCKKSNLITRHGVGLFKDDTLRALPIKIKSIIESESIQSWKKDYLTPYRDSLAHRIPLYVPSKILSKLDIDNLEELDSEINKLSLTTEESRSKHEELTIQKLNIGSVCYSMHGSFKDSERGILFHPQVLKDIEILKTICSPIFEHLLNNKE